ncbi:hypothetical protein BAUCODRAFT_21735 [Baudoinia panamericana UAMH 10762]|uniref:Large ribosomal subunit protein mL49 n=1 Tax=Baudoinia panamericana (strain UAMH 10762) TaxID=717646 RepID=M2NKU6_BAUPA|nr:uncharacterized protein BAUCODRAFT_21735 [Baudoinia panamericana UAMH 10762]EMD00075.1 hypothetical protein BAUCODRAFT_21735 [Baudoinia panamericana UAMH 10762]
MASVIPLMPFLRPLGLPRPSTIRQLLCYSTTSICHAEAQTATRTARVEDPNLIASRNASASYPPNTLKSLPRPKEPRASRRANHPRAERTYPTRHPTHHPVTEHKLIPEPVEPLPADQCAPNLPYFVTRTPSMELPVYQLRKRGGNMKLTRVKKVDGKVESLRDELRAALGLGEKEAVVNPVTRHVMLKGHLKTEVDKFLRERMF